MSTTGFIRRMLERGFSYEDALLAAEAFEAEVVDIMPTRSKGAERQARYMDRKRQQTSLNDENDDNDASDESPKTKVFPTPLSKTHPPKGGDITTRTRKADADPEGFAAFYEAFPRRTGRDAARRAFSAAIAKGATLAQMLMALDRDKGGDWLGQDTKFIPHPATWLNRGSWRDETADQPKLIPTLRPNHDRPSRQSVQLEERFENYQRAFAGAEVAAKRGALEPSGGF